MDFKLTLDPKRTEEYVTRNGSRFAMNDPEVRRDTLARLATGITIPSPTPDGQIEAVDLYCLDNVSLLRYLRLASGHAEAIVFALLGLQPDDYLHAHNAIVTSTEGASTTQPASSSPAPASNPAAAVEVPALPVDLSAADHDCG